MEPPPRVWWIEGPDLQLFDNADWRIHSADGKVGVADGKKLGRVFEYG